jgi:lysophospholipase L1-like esterase
MKKILFAILVLIGINSFGQVPTGFQVRIVRERIQGKLMVDSVFYVPRYTDTVQANLHRLTVDTCGAMFFSYTKDSLYYRACNPKRWITVGSGGFSNPMIDVGDMIRGGASGVPTRLPAGGEGDVLTFTGGIPAWGTVPGNNISNSNLTSTANHTLDLNGFTQTITGGTWGHDSVKFTNTLIFSRPDSGLFVGNSITAGANATAGNSYPERATAYYGLTMDNKAVSGRGAYRSILEANAAENPGHTKMLFAMFGFNDGRRTDTTNALTYRKTQNKIINALKALFINHNLKYYEGAGNGANVVRVGTFTTGVDATAGGGKTTNAAFTAVLNDTIKFTATGTSIVASPLYSDGISSVYTNNAEVYLDNVLQYSVDLSRGTDNISDGANSNELIPGGIIFSGLTYGVHELKLVNKQNLRPMLIDYFGVLRDINDTYPLVIFHAPKIDATGYATSPAGASDWVIDLVNAKIDSLVATFPAGYPVYVARTNDFYVNTTASGDLDIADHIHPTDQGHEHIFDAVVDVFPSFPVFAGTTRTFFWSGGRPWAIDSVGAARPLAYKGEAAAVAGSNRQVQYNNNGAFGGATGFEVGNTNNRVLIESQATGENNLNLKLSSGQTVDALKVTTNSNTTVWNVTNNGGMSVFGDLGNPTNGNAVHIQESGGTGFIYGYDFGSSWIPLNISASTLRLQSGATNKVTVESSRTTLLDSVYLSEKIPYNSSAGIVHLGIDTVASSPTFGKLVRKTAGGVIDTLTISTRAWRQKGLDSLAALRRTISKGVFIALPTSADTVDVWQTPVAITITSLKAVLRGTTPSVTYNIGFGTSIQSPTAVFTSDITCTSITTGCSNSSGFNDATIPAGSFIWIYTNAASGTIRSIALTINYTED